jgi:hypothetical protein
MLREEFKFKKTYKILIKLNQKKNYCRFIEIQKFKTNKPKIIKFLKLNNFINFIFRPKLLYSKKLYFLIKSTYRHIILNNWIKIGTLKNRYPTFCAQRKLVCIHLEIKNNGAKVISSQKDLLNKRKYEKP